MQTYALFYRTHGIRTVAQLGRPPMSELTDLTLPTGSVLHYIDTDTTTIGISPKEAIIRSIAGVKPSGLSMAGQRCTIITDHVVNLSLSAARGRPISTPLQPLEQINAYHRQYKRFRRYQGNQSLLNDARNLLVVNYNLIAQHYRYQPHWSVAYNRWANLYQTVWDRVAQLVHTSNRQHFVQVQMPDRILPISLLDRLGDHTTQNVMARFNTDALRMLGDLWQWLGADRAQSVLGTLTATELGRVNLIWIHAGRWTVLNLGIINDWRKDPEVVRRAPVQIDMVQLQRRFLRMMMSINETTTAGPEEAVIDAQASMVVETTGDSEEAGLSDDERFKRRRTQRSKLGNLVDIVRKANMTTEGVVRSDDEVIVDEDDLDDASIAQDLAQLEIIDQNTEVSDGLDYKAYVPPPDDLTGAVARIADDMARKQLLSAAEHRRIVALGSQYRKIPNPYTDEGSLADMAVFSKKELAVAATSPLMDHIPGVVDPSMLSCSLREFDERYIRNVLPKDMVSMVLNLQRAGIVIQDYQIQEHDDYNDSFDIHVIKVVPVIGKPTTLRIQYPRVAEDGTFRAGGVKYRMRKQRGD